MAMRLPGSQDGIPAAAWPVSAEVLLNSTLNGWLLVDADGTIVAINNRMQELFGYTQEEIIGLGVEMLVPPRQRVDHVLQRQDYNADPKPRLTSHGLSVFARRQDGSEFPADISLNPIQTEGHSYTLVVVRDITDRISLEEERSVLTTELEMERERQRIGMDLHDGIMQEIYAAGLTLELAQEDLGDRPEDARQGIIRAIGQLHEVIRNIRAYIFDLRPRQFSGDLIEALGELGREFQQNSQVETQAHLPGDLPPFDEERAMTLYHITHEALSNIQRHAQATLVSISLEVSEAALRLEVRDNGRGFDTGVYVPQQHRGMRNMSERARACGGYLDVSSVPSQGTTLRVELPLSN